MFGKRHSGKRIDLTCPSCGQVQVEPALVVSSFCRSCGEHFRVRKGIAFANPALRVSGIVELTAAEPREEEPTLASAELSPDLGLDPAASKDSPPLPGEEREANETEILAGAFFGFTSSPEEGALGPASLGGKAESREALGQGSLGALIASGQATVVVADRDRMPPNYVPPASKRGREEEAPPSTARCFRCHHIQPVSRFAKSTQCERCSTYICLADYEIKSVKKHTLKTRGDIVITRKGGLVDGSEIACHHLVVNGAIDATIDCSGDALFRHSGTAHGKLHCDRLVIERGCEVRFPDGAMARRAEIAGTLSGDLTCSGKVVIARTGQVEGDVTTTDLEIKEGGQVNGETRIDLETNTDLPLSKGFNPAVIG